MKKKRIKAFTLIEMLVVLLIISVLLLLFVPNLAKEKKNIQNTGQTAVVEGQAELYQLDKQDSPNLGKLVSDGLITQKQADSYNDYYTKNPNAKRNVPN